MDFLYLFYIFTKKVDNINIALGYSLLEANSKRLRKEKALRRFADRFRT